MLIEGQFQWIFLTTREWPLNCSMIMPVEMRTSNNTADVCYSNGLNWRPQPFKVSIQPRSERIRQTIVREGEQALVDLAQYDGETKYRMSTFNKKT